MINAKTVTSSKPDVQIVMPWEAAEALASVCRRISGDTRTSLRRHFDSTTGILQALRGLGIEGAESHSSILSGGINFQG